MENSYPTVLIHGLNDSCLNEYTIQFIDDIKRKVRSPETNKEIYVECLEINH